MTGLGPSAAAVRAALTDPHQLCAALGLLEGYRPAWQAGGLLIRCPAHGDRTPSCSVRRAADGTIAVSCFGCGWTGDALTLIAAAHGLDLRSDFATVLAHGVALAGGSVPEGMAGRVWAPPAPPSYPPADELIALWEAAVSVEEDEKARAYLADERRIDPGGVALYDLARALPEGALCPSWARVRGRPWSESGHRLLLPVVDHTGEVRSLRAWRIEGDDEGPKRVAPAGHSVVGLVLACPTARQILPTGARPAYFDGAPLEVVITEGEPDFLTHAADVSDATNAPLVVLGVFASAWSQALADRVPDGSQVFIRTHLDPSGDRYAAAILASFAGRDVDLFDLPRAPGSPAHV